MEGLGELCDPRWGAEKEVSHVLLWIRWCCIGRVLACGPCLLVLLHCRHEYLGPDPRVAGYRIDVEGDVHIKWWDAFLQDQWMDKQKWAFDVRMEDDGRWVEVDD